MCDLEISSLGSNGNILLRSWATKCDANGDGKIGKDELSVFEQGKNSMDRHTGIVIVGGVEIISDQIKTIQKNDNNNKFDYYVEFNNGVKVQYDKQNYEDNDSKLFSSYNQPNETYSDASNFTDGDGISITGTNGKDNFSVHNCKISEINAKKDVDSIWAIGCIGTSEQSTVYVEDVRIFNSSNLIVKPDTKTRLRPSEDEKPKKLTEDNPNLKIKFP